MPLWRGQQKHVYHICARCGFRQPLSKMRWQNGILVCGPTGCLDKAIIGQRDLAVSRAISVDRQELTPDKKLTEPVERDSDDKQILF